MAFTLQQLIDQATSAATRGQDASLSPALSSEMVAEDLLDLVFDQVSGELAGSSATRSLLRRTKTLNFANGEALLDEEVLTDFLIESSLRDAADNTKIYSLVSWNSFVQSLDQRLGYYSIEGESTLHVLEPNTPYDPASGPTISLLLTTPCTVVKPAVATDDIDVRNEVVSRLLKVLTDALMPLTRKVVRA